MAHVNELVKWLRLNVIKNQRMIKSGQKKFLFTPYLIWIKSKKHTKEFSHNDDESKKNNPGTIAVTNF